MVQVSGAMLGFGKSLQGIGFGGSDLGCHVGFRGRVTEEGLGGGLQRRRRVGVRHEEQEMLVARGHVR